jgi:small GTP-binding protein
MPDATQPIQKKVCMVGSYGVGKTSLVRRYVEGMFSDRYLTNIGVKIDKKLVDVNGQQVNIVLWDLAGEDEISTLRMSHLRGASGYILVVDGTRRITLEKALEIQQRIQDPLGGIPFVVAFNKMDLRPEWEITEEAIDGLSQRGWPCFIVSAKTGESVERAFQLLANKMLTHRK